MKASLRQGTSGEQEKILADKHQGEEELLYLCQQSGDSTLGEQGAGAGGMGEQGLE